MKRAQCPCGKLLALPAGSRAAKFRCPACGSVLRLRSDSVRPGRSSNANRERSVAEAADEYHLLPYAKPETPAPASHQPGQPSGWFPTPARRLPTSGRAQTSTLFPKTDERSDESLDAAEFPGPFLDRSAVLYPWLHPTWACWLGLAFMTELAVLAIGATAFFFVIIMTLGAFLSLFTFAAMMTVCVGLTAYVLTTFEMVLEQTANGENRLSRLPGYVWYEILPAFLRIVGAAGSACGIPIGLTYLCRDWLGPWDNPIAVAQVLLLNVVTVFFLFPIFVISNSAEQSFLPIWALFPTLSRLVRCGGYFAVFLVMSGVLWVGVFVVLVLLAVLHVAAAIALAGPLFAMWALYYGHWLGRVVRQMMATN